MPTNQHPVEPTERQRASMARIILQMGAQRFTFPRLIRAHIETLEMLTKEAADLHVRADRLEHEDAQKREAMSPAEISWHDKLKNISAKSGKDWRDYLIKQDDVKFLTICHETAEQEAAKVRFYLCNPGKTLLANDPRLKNFTLEALKRRASITGEWLQNKPPYRPSPHEIDVHRGKYDPYCERVPALIAHLVQMRAALASLSTNDLSVCDFIELSIIRPLERAQRERDLRIAATARDSLESLATIADGEQDQLTEWAATSSEKVNVAAKKKGKGGAKPDKKFEFRRKLEEASRGGVKLPWNNGNSPTRQDLARQLVNSIATKSRQPTTGTAERWMQAWKVRPISIKVSDGKGGHDWQVKPECDFGEAGAE